jgi:predicted DNA-binding protein
MPMVAERRTARPSGRPPAGVRQGERVKDYPQTSLRLPPEIKSKLYALSRVSGSPQWRVVSAALECFFRERSAAEQRQVIRLMGKQPAAPGRRSSRRST